MALKGNREWGKKLAEAVKQDVDDPNYQLPPPPTSWLRAWIDPVSSRERYRRWLSRWLKSALQDIPSDVSARYFEQMADDIRQLDEVRAVDLFIDKVLPKLFLNESRDEHRSKVERAL